MKTLLPLMVICVGLGVIMPTSSQRAFFIPIPSAFAPVTEFACPGAGTIFTYDIRLWSTNRPNRMVAVKQDQLNCRIRSDAQGTYDWFGGLGPHLGEEDAAEKQLITDLWPLRAGDVGTTSKYDLPSRYGKIEYVVDAYGIAVVPAGPFWAYKIRKNYYWQDSLCYTTTVWWSPALKWVILQWPEQAGGYKWGLLSVSSP
jgi:hypothetical protein